MRRQKAGCSFLLAFTCARGIGHARSVASKEELASTTAAAMAPSATRAAAASPGTSSSISARALHSRTEYQKLAKNKIVKGREIDGSSQ